MGPNALGTIKNEYGDAKLENGTRCRRNRRKRVRKCKTLKRDPTPEVPPKMSSGAQNLKMGPYAIGTAKKESGRAKYENGSRRPRYQRK
jgi:hypothetical protein